ncbi:MAG: hypothetical protein PVH34_07105, partial [Syntrophobacterales bacterium]
HLACNLTNFFNGNLHVTIIYFSYSMLLENSPVSELERWLQKSTGIVVPEPPDNIIIVSGIWQPLTRIFHELPSRGCGEGCATRQPQGVGFRT